MLCKKYVHVNHRFYDRIKGEYADGSVVAVYSDDEIDDEEAVMIANHTMFTYHGVKMKWKDQKRGRPKRLSDMVIRWNVDSVIPESEAADKKIKFLVLDSRVLGIITLGKNTIDEKGITAGQLEERINGISCAEDCEVTCEDIWLVICEDLEEKKRICV